MTLFSVIKKRIFWLHFFEVLCLLFVIIGLCQVSNAASGWEYKFVSAGYKWIVASAAMVVVGLVIALGLQKIKTTTRLDGWLQGIIIFYVAYEISVYGFAKILKTQFQPPTYILDTPIGDLNGFWLTWVYYGHSQTLAYILGATQIGGCILLLFRKTRLAGVFILLPVMVNIILVNHFYDISALAYFNSVQYTFILFFLLLLDYDKLKTVFSYKGASRLDLSTGLLNIARLLVIAGAFFTIWMLKKGVSPVTKLNGAWQVQTLTKNNIPATPALYPDSVFAKIYFEWRYGCLFRYNLYKFEDKDLYGAYKADEKQQTLHIGIYSNEENRKTDSPIFHYQFTGDSILQMEGKYKADIFSMVLKRVR